MHTLSHAPTLTNHHPILSFPPNSPLHQSQRNVKNPAQCIKKASLVYITSSHRSISCLFLRRSLHEIGEAVFDLLAVLIRGVLGEAVQKLAAVSWDGEGRHTQALWSSSRKLLCRPGTGYPWPSRWPSAATWRQSCRCPCDRASRLPLLPVGGQFLFSIHAFSVSTYVSHFGGLAGVGLEVDLSWDLSEYCMRDTGWFCWWADVEFDKFSPAAQPHILKRPTFYSGWCEGSTQRVDDVIDDVIQFTNITIHRNWSQPSPHSDLIVPASKTAI